ncbi:MAG TPA: zinc ABC transporter substrate-binding protein [Stellaceae bacterium]|nr:zinc ABC transporter substrate-binding protein [Stellaceae bacterium]
MKRAGLLFAALCFLALARTAPAAEPLTVVATFSVLGDMVATIGGDRIALTTIVGGDGDSELYQPTPADARRLAGAKLLVLNDINPEFEPWLDGLIRQSGFKGAKIVASRGARIITEAEEEGHEAGNAAPKSDQHAWHDLANGAIYARNIGEALAAADPANADFYKERADAYIAEIKRLDAWAKAEIAQVPKSKRKVITSHDGFEYLGKAYGIKLVPARGWANDKEASADDVARLVKQVREDKIRAIFVENMNDPRVIERVAQETGAAIGGTLYSDALSQPGGEADTYLKMARHNIAALKAGMLKN